MGVVFYFVVYIGCMVGGWMNTMKHGADVQGQADDGRVVPEKTFEIRTGIQLQFAEHNVPSGGRKRLSTFPGFRKNFTVVLKVDDVEAFSMEHSIFTANIAKTAEDIKRIIECLRDDTPSEKIVEMLKTLLNSKHKACQESASAWIVVLDIAEHLKDFRDIHTNVIKYLIGNMKINLSENTESGYCSIEFMSAPTTVQRARVTLRNMKLIYYFYINLFEIPEDQVGTKYSKVEMRTIDTESPLISQYSKIVQSDSRSLTYFFPNIKRAHLEGTDLVILRKVIGILETYTPELQRDPNLEYTIFTYEKMLYCAVHKRIELHTESQDESYKMITEISNVLDPTMVNKTNKTWTSIECLMNKRHEIYNLSGDTFRGLMLIEPFSELNKANFKKILSFLVGDDEPIPIKDDGIKVMKYIRVNGNYRQALVEWEYIEESKYIDMSIHITKKNIHTEIPVSLNEDDRPPSLSLWPERDLDQIDQLSSNNPRFESKYNSQNEKLLITLHRLNRILDTPSAGP